MFPSDFIAHVRRRDAELQTVAQHTWETAELSESFASAIGLPLCGRVLGLCHDFGKFSAAYRDYIMQVSDMFGEEAKAAAELKRGTIDHATAGAQLIWDALRSRGQLGGMAAQVLSVAVMSHHSRTGMKDFISLEGKSPFLERLARDESKTYRQECFQNADAAILGEINQLLTSPALLEEFSTIARGIKSAEKGVTVRLFSYSLLTRFLFSCLLDADRLNTADFEHPGAARYRSTGRIPNWVALTAKLEEHLSGLGGHHGIDQIRKQISDECRAAASRTGHLFTLTVPTGGGKTLASLRFALHRASQSTGRPVERLIYVIPYTTITDQNAKDIRAILGEENVLEHHSNLTPENDTWLNRLLSENWDAPVVFTTSVQFLNCLFAKSTRSARRLHQLANSILIFDEIQTLPIRTIHAFNNAINFLTLHANTTALLCTATMPILHRVDPSRGALFLTPESEIVSDKQLLFQQLKRTAIIDKRRTCPWSHEEISSFAIECSRLHRSTLVVCNTKKSARELFERLRSNADCHQVIHLSTNMCPAHRLEIIDQMKKSLDSDDAQQLICVSTQLIEAGVNLDFGCVIRSLAGLDSIIQAGGRCNRHGKRHIGYVYILNFAEESLGPALVEMANAQEVTQRVLDEFQDDPASLDDDLLSEATMDRFYEYNFFQRAAEMHYPLPAGQGNPPLAAKTSMLSLLSDNLPGREAAERRKSTEAGRLRLGQGFSTAAQAFCVIDAPTRGIIVPYREGARLIADICAAFANDGYPIQHQIGLLKKAQRYTVNTFPHIVDNLSRQGAVREIQPGSEILYLDERHYDSELGLTTEASSKLPFLGTKE